ncbi:hypothetical protein QBC44DRAFT_45199 [Cladorrhinum sp. PSN332]|nr:hypothetical protein QBC44DRAFT_45199 [Cladorrhinum sp. PSN332]
MTRGFRPNGSANRQPRPPPSSTVWLTLMQGTALCDNGFQWNHGSESRQRKERRRKKLSVPDLRPHGSLSIVDGKKFNGLLSLHDALILHKISKFVVCQFSIMSFFPLFFATCLICRQLNAKKSNPIRLIMILSVIRQRLFFIIVRKRVKYPQRGENNSGSSSRCQVTHSVRSLPYNFSYQGILPLPFPSLSPSPMFGTCCKLETGLD